MADANYGQNRHPVRLQCYDYSQNGAYYFTICTQKRECLFGQIEGNAITLTDAGRALNSAWMSLPSHYAHVMLDEAVIMPNHFHGIVFLQDIEGVAQLDSPEPKRHTLSEIIRNLKTYSAKEINGICQTPGRRVWQRSFWERVLRNESELLRVREYIGNNYLQWHLDRLNPYNC